MKQPRVVLIDNYDSYVFNLFQRVGELTSARATVLRNDETTVEEVAALEPTHLILSPGPGNPENPEYFGVCSHLIEKLGRFVPLLGVCLGHQGLAATFGARVVRAPQVMHGKASRIFHDGTGLFQSLPNPFVAMRYHSLVVARDSIPDCLKVTAWTEDGIVMGLAHREFPIFGVQFHPESIGTPQGPALLSAFLSFEQGLRSG